jgi:hypothetical protein
MINLQAEELREAKGLDYWKLRLRDTAYNREAGKFLVDSLNDIREGDSLAYVVLRNGCVEPNIDGNTDGRIYLAGF